MKTATFTITRPDTGAVLPLAIVTVFNADGVTRATIFNADGSAQGNPITASNNGAITIAAADATYVLQAVAADGTYSVPSITVDLLDVPAFKIAMNAQVAAATTQANIALTAGSTGNPYANAYASTLPKGVTSIAIGTAGTGGTAGTYALGVSGGPTGFAGTYTISGGGVTAITITNPGLSTTTTAPTLSFPSGSVTGAAATATVSTLIADQKTYWVASADSSQILLYGNNGGSIATAPFGGTQLGMYAKGTVDSVIATANDVATRAPAPFQVKTNFNGVYSHHIVAENGYVLAKIEALTGKWVMGISSDSVLPTPPQLGSITFRDISEISSGWMLPFLDANGLIIGGFKADGSFVAQFNSGIAIPAIEISGLTQKAQRQVAPFASDVVPVLPDNWRGSQAGLPVRTAADGTHWTRLSAVMTNTIRGFNGSGTALQFRRSANLPIKGTRYAGTFTPAVASTNFRSTFSTALPSTAGAATGDYWIFTNTTPQTLGADTYNIGDLAVWNGSALVAQPGPTPLGGAAYTNRQPGDWWIVSAALAFDGVTYAAGDRIVYLGFQSASGLGYARWAKGTFATTGELFYRGEFDASGGSLPASPANGEVYQVSVAGTAGGIAWAVSDYAVYESGAWGRVPTDPIQSIAASAYVSLSCFALASEWEVRRTDKSATRATTQLNVRVQSLPKRSLDNLTLYSDSLFGVSTVGAKILTALARTGTVNSFGGGTSADVLSMLHFEIARLGDRYEGTFHLFWHGQNNQPAAVGDANWAQLTQASLAMRQLLGARDPRVMFLSVLGQRSMSWNGSRLVCAQLEDQFNKTGALYALEQWYAAMFPGQWISPRQILLAAAASSSVPDLSYPGLTEAQVAATYGVLPARYYVGWASLPPSVQLSPASSVYTGTWATAGLPTGGTAGDYKIRTANGTVGSLIFNDAGTWTEPSFDVTHLSEDGATALSSGVAAIIVANNF